MGKSNLEELNTRLLMLFNEDEYQILFSGKAYIIYEEDSQSKSGMTGVIIKNDGTKLIETKFKYVVSLNKDGKIQGYCLIKPDVYMQYINSFYKIRGNRWTAIQRGSLYINVPILKPDLSIDIGKLEVNRYSRDIPDFILRHNQKTYLCRFCDKTNKPLKFS